MNMRGVIIEISKSKIKNRIVNIKKLIENGIFKIVFSLNPHSKLVLIILCLFMVLKFIIELIINRKLMTKVIIMVIFIKIINFFSY